jgi:hypothetical protein
MTLARGSSRHAFGGTKIRSTSVKYIAIYVVYVVRVQQQQHHLPVPYGDIPSTVYSTDNGQQKLATDGRLQTTQTRPESRPRDKPSTREK